MLPVVLTGILFLFAGVSKLFMMTPSGFAENMVMPVFGVGMGLALLLSWLVIIFDVLGGIALLAGCKFPKMAFKWLVWGLVIIMIASVLFVHAKNADFMSMLKDLIIASILVGVLPKKHCSEGMCKTEEKKCDGGKCCEDGTCKA